MRYNSVFIESFGYELPPNVVASEDLEARLEPLYRLLRIQPGQLEALTGIHERRFWDPGYKVSQGAIAAGRKAIENSGVRPYDIGMLIYGGVCRDNLEPATACVVADGLGLSSHAQLFDVSNACLGVINGMIHVANAIELGQIKAGLVVSCETAREIVDITIARLLESRNMDIFKKTVATLTGGSGAVAVLMTHESISESGHRLAGGVCRNAANFHRLCTWGPDAGITSEGIHMMETDSVGVLQNGVKLGRETYHAFRESLSWPEPDKIVCHQVGSAHQRSILDAIGIPPEKDFTTFRFLGNIGTVSLPITAAVAAEREFFEPDDKIGFFGIGSGLNCLMLGVVW